MLSFYGVKEMGAREWFEQLPLFAAVSICSGLLGALFNTLHKALLSVRYRFLFINKDSNASNISMLQCACGKVVLCADAESVRIAGESPQGRQFQAHGRSCHPCSHHSDYDAGAQLLPGHLCGGARLATEELRLHLPLPRRYTQALLFIWQYPRCSSGNILSDQDPLFSAKCGVEAVRCCGSAGKYNDLATAFMAFPVKTISHLFSLGSLTPQVVIVPNLDFTCIL